MDKVEAAYKKVMALAAGTGEYTMGSMEELDVAVSELMIAVMEMTEGTLNAVHDEQKTGVVVTSSDDILRQKRKIWMTLVDLRHFLKALQGGGE